MAVRIDELTRSLSSSSYNSRLTWLNNESENQNSESHDLHHPHHSKHKYSNHHSRGSDDDPDGGSGTEEEDIDVLKERRTQHYMITMVTLFAMCWCPINLLILVTHFVYEDDHNSGHFDITYLTFTFFGFLSTCVNPVLFASWRLSDSAKERLRGYFRFDGSRRRSSRQRSPQSSDSVFHSPSPNPAAASNCKKTLIENGSSYLHPRDSGRRNHHGYSNRSEHRENLEHHNKSGSMPISQTNHHQSADSSDHHRSDHRKHHRHSRSSSGHAKKDDGADSRTIAV